MGDSLTLRNINRFQSGIYLCIGDHPSPPLFSPHPSLPLSWQNETKSKVSLTPMLDPPGKNDVPPSVSKRVRLYVDFPPTLWITHQLVGVRLRGINPHREKKLFTPKIICVTPFWPPKKFETMAVSPPAGGAGGYGSDRVPHRRPPQVPQLLARQGGPVHQPEVRGGLHIRQRRK